jgi:hypothetical protein
MADGAYISGALNGVPDLPRARAWYEWLGEVCREAGFTPYIPHKRTDPELTPELDDREVYARDREAHSAASVIVADIGTPSLGVGGEIASACLSGQPVIAVHRVDQRPSRYTRGQILTTTNGRVIAYRDAADCRRQLMEALAGVRGIDQRTDPVPPARPKTKPESGGAELAR